ncbi:glycosyltransferase [Poseidonibacter lekithochrous]|uniref:glycosyltransferase n=1 Tax=Poseidonibacter lekithochrous TaxID=1904463 RepID=UPI000D3AFE51|nr:glycosyltransferase [Poseidonibacter lekithochrous]
MYKLRIFISHPIYYHLGIWRELEKIKDLDSKVYYFSDTGLKEFIDSEMNVKRSWGDESTLQGYKNKILKNYGINKDKYNFFSKVNFSIFNIIRKEKPDAVLVNGYVLMSDWITILSAKFFGSKVIFRGEANLKDSDYCNSYKSKIKKIVLPIIFNFSNKVLYSCQGNKEYYLYYGVDEKKLVYYPCSVDNTFFQNKRKILESDRTKIRKEFGINNDDLVLIMVGKIINLKRPYDLVDSVSKINHKNIKIIFLGDGPEKEKLEQYSKEKKINAIFPGFKTQNEISKYFIISDLYCMLSNKDNSPKAMNEAMNFGLPVICTDIVGTAKDLIDDKKNGFLVKTGDIETISNKIDFLNNNRKVLVEFSKKSFEKINDFTFKRDANSIYRAIKGNMNEI